MKWGWISFVIRSGPRACKSPKSLAQDYDVAIVWLAKFPGFNHMYVPYECLCPASNILYIASAAPDNAIGFNMVGPVKSCWWGYKSPYDVTSRCLYISPMRHVDDGICFQYAKSASEKLGFPFPVLYIPKDAPLKKKPLSNTGSARTSRRQPNT